MDFLKVLTSKKVMHINTIRTIIYRNEINTHFEMWDSAIVFKLYYIVEEGRGLHLFKILNKWCIFSHHVFKPNYEIPVLCLSTPLLCVLYLAACRDIIVFNAVKYC